MTGSAFDQRIVIRNAGFLRGLWNAIDVRAECDDGLASAPRSDPRGGNAGDALLDLEALFFENAGEVLRGLNFLKAEFAEAENHVDHDLRLLRHGGDVRDDLRFVIIDRRRAQCDTGLSAGKQSGEAKHDHNYSKFMHKRAPVTAFNL